jgi:hypothetical protein
MKPLIKIATFDLLEKYDIFSWAADSNYSLIQTVTTSRF